MNRYLKHFHKVQTLFKEIKGFNPENVSEYGKKNYFRPLTHFEHEAVNVIDNRNFKSKTNNKIFLTAEHASNDVKFMSGTFPNTALINSEFGHDIGTKDVILLLIEKLECIGALANFSKLVVDPNRTVYDSALIPAYVNGEKIEFNQDCNKLERILNFYTPYHFVIREILEHIEPEFHISLHSYPPIKNQNQNTFQNPEVELKCRGSNVLFESICSEFETNQIHFSSDCNSNCSSVSLSNDWVTNCRNTEENKEIHSILLKFRNDKLADSRWIHSFAAQIASASDKALGSHI